MAAGLVVTATRSFEEWDAHPQGRAVAELPPFSIEKIGEAPPEPLPSGDRPLSGIKVLDLTRVIAGPVCGRTLASHGADVLLITAAHLPSMEALVIDNGRGKLSAHLDLRDASARESSPRVASSRHFRTGLPARRDRPIRLQRRASGEAAARHRLRDDLRLWLCRAVGEPARLDSLVQNANGLNDAEGKAFGLNEPKPLPAQALDHGTGFLMALPRCRRSSAAPLRAEAGTCAVRWRKLRTGAAASAGSTAPRSPIRNGGRAGPPLRQQFRLRPAHRRAPLRRHIGDADALGAAVGASRQRRCGVAD